MFAGVLIALVTVIVLPIIAIARAHSRGKELQELRDQLEKIARENSSLEARIGRLEREAAPSPTPLTEQVVSVETVSAPRREYTQPTDPPGFRYEAAPVFASVEENTHSLEQRVGGSWLNRVGITMVVAGVALFLAYQLTHVGPLGKVIAAFTLAAAALIAGLRLQKSDRYRIMGHTLLGGGWVLLYLTVFAMHNFHATLLIRSGQVDFLLLLLVTVGMVLHSLRYRSQLLTSCTFLLAFSTLSLSHGTSVGLAAIVLLAVGIVIVCVREAWSYVELLGLVGTYANYAAWLQQHHAEPTTAGFWTLTCILVFTFTLFRRGIISGRELDANEVEEIFVPILNSVFFLALTVYGIARGHEFFFASIAVVLDLAFTWIARHQRRASNVLGGIAIAEILFAIPLHFHSWHWPAMWLLISQLLCLIAIKLGRPEIRTIGSGIVGLTLLHVLGSGASSGLDHTSSALLSTCAFVLLIDGVVLPRLSSPQTSLEEHLQLPICFTAAGAAAIAIAIVVGQWQMLACWSILGILIFLAGLWSAERGLRLAGVSLLLLAVAKLSVYDVWQLEVTARYLSLIGVGIALLGVSFLYSRYSERIRQLL